jgi:hypothetical protein
LLTAIFIKAAVFFTLNLVSMFFVWQVAAFTPSCAVAVAALLSPFFSRTRAFHSFATIGGYLIPFERDIVAKLDNRSQIGALQQSSDFVCSRLGSFSFSSLFSCFV